MCASIVFAVSACSDTDDFFNKNDSSSGVESDVNTFDFSTTRQVDIILDYSAFKTYGPVYFTVYNRNPFVKDDVINPYYLDESIEPVFADYTDEYGKYDATVKLPAYAKTLYIVTGDLYVRQKLMLAEVKDGIAKAVAKDEAETRAMTRGMMRVPGVAGVSTSDMSKFYNLWNKIDKSGNNTGTQVYKQWYTPLGTWNSASGRPDYMLSRSAENLAKGLVFSDADMQGLFKAAKSALNSTKSCGSELLSQADMTLMKESEVSITVVGGNTCWCSSLGYYYYTEATKPQSRMDMNIIMLFPNTMLNHYDDKPKCDFQGNIGLYDGDAIQLMYYPNIAEGSYAGATTKFPAGIKIGFIMKTNGWASQGSGYGLKQGVGSISWDCERKYNTWPTSTDGLSYCDASGLTGIGSYLNPNGESRTAKFSYMGEDGTEYAIVSFEDANNDLNYSDVIFSLNPASAFTALPEVGENKHVNVGVYAFEDNWPRRGDYDMNDVVVNVRDEWHFSSSNVIRQVFELTTYRKTVTLNNGLAVRLDTKGNAVKSITMKKKGANESAAKEVTFEKYKDSNTGIDVYYLNDLVENELGSTYTFEITYSSAITTSKVAEIEPFVYRTDSEENGKQWETHIPYVKPTHKMNMSYFGTEDDKSDPSQGRYYVRSGHYPFAFYLSGTKAEAFFDTILSSGDEARPINIYYPSFIDWADHDGKSSEDWYLNPVRK